jgi:hypothetical protein
VKRPRSCGEGGFMEERTVTAVEGTLAGQRVRAETAVVVLAIVALVWIGALLGVSFLATPVKFLAPSLSLPAALDVGRQTFHWFTRVELVLAAAALLAALVYERPRLASWRGAYAVLLSGLLLAAVALQILWLLPLLDARVEVIIQGGMPPPARFHDAYVLIEAAKLGALVGLAWRAVGALRARRSVAAG